VKALVEEILILRGKRIDREGEALSVGNPEKGYLALPNAGDLGLDLRPCGIGKGANYGGVPQ
jgi:hypothetical protein